MQPNANQPDTYQKKHVITHAFFSGITGFRILSVSFPEVHNKNSEEFDSKRIF
jgi:hypothetical protein